MCKESAKRVDRIVDIRNSRWQCRYWWWRFSRRGKWFRSYWIERWLGKAIPCNCIRARQTNTLAVSLLDRRKATSGASFMELIAIKSIPSICLTYLSAALATPIRSASVIPRSISPRASRFYDSLWISCKLYHPTVCGCVSQATHDDIALSNSYLYSLSHFCFTCFIFSSVFDDQVKRRERDKKCDIIQQ
jgi:hypothetical protein